MDTEFESTVKMITENSEIQLRDVQADNYSKISESEIKVRQKTTATTKMMQPDKPWSGLTVFLNEIF